MDASEFNAHLLRGERIIWWGQPAQGLMLTQQDWLLIPFSLVWCGFIIFWEMSVFAQDGTTFFKLWGLPFVLFGLYLVAGRFLLDAFVRRGLYYAVTDKRALILRTGPFSKFSALSLGQLPDLDLSERADGRGTIRFGPASSIFQNRNFSGWTPALDPTPQFIAIEDARRVFDQIQKPVATPASS